MCTPDDAPLQIVFCPGISEDELREQLADLKHWRGLPILPPGNEAQIIQITGRWEPDIEDEP